MVNWFVENSKLIKFGDESLEIFINGFVSFDPFFELLMKLLDMSSTWLCESGQEGLPNLCSGGGPRDELLNRG